MSQIQRLRSCGAIHRGEAQSKHSQCTVKAQSMCVETHVKHRERMRQCAMRKGDGRKWGGVRGKGDKDRKGKKINRSHANL